MNPFESYVREQQLPHLACAVPELEELILLDAVKRHPNYSKSLLACAALGVFGRELSQDRRFLVYIDTLVGLGYVYRHRFRYVLTPSGVERLAQLKENLRGAVGRAL